MTSPLEMQKVLLSDFGIDKNESLKNLLGFFGRGAFSRKNNNADARAKNKRIMPVCATLVDEAKAAEVGCLVEETAIQLSLGCFYAYYERDEDAREVLTKAKDSILKFLKLTFEDDRLQEEFSSIWKENHSIEGQLREKLENLMVTNKGLLTIYAQVLFSLGKNLFP